MWVIGPYFVWVTVSEALFWVSVDCFGWVGMSRGLWGIILGKWSITLGGWRWMGKYYWMSGGGWGWLGVSWGSGVGWVHCLIMALANCLTRIESSTYKYLTGFPLFFSTQIPGDSRRTFLFSKVILGAWNHLFCKTYYQTHEKNP